jgi:flagellar motor switch protein FliG
MNVLSDFMIRLDEYQKSKSDKPIVDITFNFDEFNDMTVARLKEALKELSAKEIAFIRNNTNTEIASKIEKYLGKRKQKAIDELKTIESYTKGQFNTLKNKIAKFL